MTTPTEHRRCVKCGNDIAEYAPGISLCVWCDPNDEVTHPKPTPERAYALLREIAELRKEGEADAEGNPTEWENDDTFDVLHGLISTARDILGVPDGKYVG